MAQPIRCMEPTVFEEKRQLHSRFTNGIDRRKSEAHKRERKSIGRKSEIEGRGRQTPKNSKNLYVLRQIDRNRIIL